MHASYGIHRGLSALTTPLTTANCPRHSRVAVELIPTCYRILWTGMKVLKHDSSRHHLIGIQPTVPVSRTVPRTAQHRVDRGTVLGTVLLTCHVRGRPRAAVFIGVGRFELDGTALS